MLYIARSLARAGRWFLDSGIQEKTGGVARFYQSEFQRNKPVSSEITGYTASTLVYLFNLTGEEVYLDRARATALFLAERAWNPALRTFPFEYPSPSDESRHLTYFFDCGIIIRGLLAVWRQTKDALLLDVAHAAAQGMIADFHAGSDYHPILTLPDKTPLPRTAQWSRSPGCYQLKSALAWLDVSAATGDEFLKDAYFKMLADALASHQSFLPAANPHFTMDRLHAYCYFLEGLTPVLHRPGCAEAFAWGVASVAEYLREIGPSFVRSDVHAQLLRARIYNGSSVSRPDAEALLAFQAVSKDPRIDGGFFFGRRDNAMSPHVNPVSTAFALQALGMWSGYQSNDKAPCRNLLI